MDKEARQKKLMKMKVPDLQSLFARVTGEETKAPNKIYLVRRIIEAEEEEARVEALSLGDGIVEPAQDDEQQAEKEGRGASDASEQDGKVEATESQQDEAESADTDGVQHDGDTLSKEEGEESPKTGADEKAKNSTKGEDKPQGQEAAQIEEEDNAEEGGIKLVELSLDELSEMYERIVGKATASQSRTYLIRRIVEFKTGKRTVGKRAQRIRRHASYKVLPLRLEVGVVEQVDAAWKRQGMRTRMEFLRAAMHQMLRHMGETEAANSLMKKE